jgi:hypothetical protein
MSHTVFDHWCFNGRWQDGCLVLRGGGLAIEDPPFAISSKWAMATAAPVAQAAQPKAALRGPPNDDCIEVLHCGNFSPVCSRTMYSAYE